MLNDIITISKLLGGSIIVSLTILAIGILGIINIQRVNKISDELYNVNTIRTNYLKDAKNDLMYINRAIRSIVQVKDLNEERIQLEKIDQLDNKFVNEMKIIEEMNDSNDGKKIFDTVIQNYGEYIKEMLDYKNIILKQDLLKNDLNIIVKIDTLVKKENQIDDALNALTEKLLDNEQTKFKDFNVIYAEMKIMMIILIITGILMSILIGYFHYKRIRYLLESVV